MVRQCRNRRQKRRDSNKQSPDGNAGTFSIIPIGLVLLLLFSLRIVFGLRRSGHDSTMYAALIIISIIVLVIGVAILLIRRKRK